MPDPLERADLRSRVQHALDGFLTLARKDLSGITDDLVPFVDTVTSFLLGSGKRLRPAFCYWGWRGAGGADGDAIVTAAAALELVHACALIHDDVMDRSDLRRGRPAVHCSFAGLHREQGWRGNGERFGSAAAILLGDLCLVWADQMRDSSGLAPEALRRAAGVNHEMRVELMAGQYLDLLESVRGRPDAARSLRIARYKSGKYTVERPLQLGGLMAGASAPVLAAYARYAAPLGEAFQLRDDVLGVFGDPRRTGKPAGDDLREGKRTVLIAHAFDAAGPSQLALLDRELGNPHLSADGVDALRTVLVATGALDTVEKTIDRRTAEAVRALGAAPIHREAAAVLAELATGLTTRDT